MKRNQGITGKIKELILKRKTDLKEGLIIDNSNLCIMFFLIDWLLVIIWRRGEKVGGGGVRLKLDVQRQEGGIFLDVDGQGVWGLENCLDVKRISSLGLVFREKREFYLFFYNAIFKDRVLFK